MEGTAAAPTVSELQNLFVLGRAGTVRSNFAKHIVKESSEDIEKMTAML